MGSSPHLWFCVCKTATLGLELQVSAGEKTPPVVFAYKTATFCPEYKSLWVHDLTCRFVHAKQRDLHPNYKFTWVAALICGFVYAK